MPPMTSSDFASEMPAGATLGQASTHLPHRVQASSMSSTCSFRAVSNGISFMGSPAPAAVGTEPPNGEVYPALRASRRPDQQIGLSVERKQAERIADHRNQIARAGAMR